MPQEGTLFHDMSGKRGARIGVSASLFSPSVTEALPRAVVQVNGHECQVLVDTGCTRTIVQAAWGGEWRKRNVAMVTVSEQKWMCQGVTVASIEVEGGVTVHVEAYVTNVRPLGFPCILGMDAIGALGGVTVDRNRRVTFGAQLEESCAAAKMTQVAVQGRKEESRVDAATDVRRENVAMKNEELQVEAVSDSDTLQVEERDFGATFDPVARRWIMEWKWGDAQEPGLLKNKLEGYAIPEEARVEYETEVRQWIERGWLLLYDEKRLGPVKGLIPMMAVVQENKDKVRPVMDFRELNRHIDAFTREADVCADKLRDWRRRGVNVSMVDLKKAYLQIGVREELWPYQTVRFEGRQYCLTRLGFGLNVAPLVMKAVLNRVLEQDEVVRAGTSAYVDDILVDEDVIAAQDVVEHLRAYGLDSKPPERVGDGVRALGLHVWQQHGVLRWRRGGAAVKGNIHAPTRREVFSLCGKLVGHYPVCGWLRVATGFVKRRASRATDRWDDVVEDPEVAKYLREILARVEGDDPVKGRWDVKGDAARLWVDASVLALGAVLEVDGDVVEDASWLRKECASHINMAELDAVVKGVNLALAWKVRRVEVMTDSATVHKWIEDGLTGKRRLRTKASNEMLIRRRVDIVMELVREYGLEMTIVLVPSADNKADALTRVPVKWLKKGEAEPLVCVAADGTMEERVREIHHEVGHPGVRRTMYFAKRKYPHVDKRVAQEVVRGCAECRSIDPAPEKWRKGCLEVEGVWQRLAMDVTHVEGQHFLTMIDCGPSRFAIWRLLRWQTSESVMAQLEAVFFERGPPEEILTDNDPAFKSKQFMGFADEWGVRLRFRAAHVPSGNGIVERCHRTVKTIAARKRCSIGEAVHLYNVTPRDDCTSGTAPANALYQYAVRVRAVDEVVRRKEVASRYRSGDAVWVRPPNNRCDQRYTRGVVTRAVSEHTVEVDGVPRHVRDLRRRDESVEEVVRPADGGGAVGQADADDDDWEEVLDALEDGETEEVVADDDEGTRVGGPVLRRSSRLAAARRMLAGGEG